MQSSPEPWPESNELALPRVDPRNSGQSKIILAMEKLIVVASPPSHLLGTNIVWSIRQQSSSLSSSLCWQRHNNNNNNVKKKKKTSFFFSFFFLATFFGQIVAAPGAKARLGLGIIGSVVGPQPLPLPCRPHPPRQRTRLGPNSVRPNIFHSHRPYHVFVLLNSSPGG